MADLLAPLTMAELLRELALIGADLETTTFVTPFGPVTHLDDDYEISRLHGAVVVSLGNPEDGEEGWQSTSEALAEVPDAAL